MKAERLIYGNQNHENDDAFPDAAGRKIGVW
jgi:hypothetical protein